MKTLNLALVASLLFLGSGCVVEHHHNCVGSGCTSDYGDITFDWEFRLSNGIKTPNCSDAYVSTIYYELYDASDIRVGYGEVSCESQYKVTLYDYLVGQYILDVEGLSSSRVIYFKSSYDVDVLYGSNDLGVLTLYPYP